MAFGSLELGAGSSESTERILAILHKWGIHTLGELAPLDKEELRNRLGADAVRLWQRANGTATRLLKFVQPPESFDESFEFDHEIETAEPLLFMLRRFLEQLAVRLSAIYLVAQELTLRISFSNSRQVRLGTDSSDWRNESAVVATTTRTDKKTYERVFKIPQPTNDVDLLFRMLHMHLENFKSEHPIVAVSLDAQPIKPASQQFGLFETALRNPQQLYETLARLTGLLGADRVGTPVLEETYRPDAFRMEPFSWNPISKANGTDDPHPTLSQTHSFALTGASRPSLPRGERERRTCDSTAVREGAALRRFRPAVAASVFVSESIPVHIQSAGKINGKVADQRGPYLLSGNW